MKKTENSVRHQLICGKHPVIEALRAGQQLDKVLLKRETIGEIRDEILSLAKNAAVPVQFVPGEKLHSLAGNDLHQGVIAIASLVYYRPLEEILPESQEGGKIPFFIILDQVTDVRNFGAIARTAECMGVNALIIPESGSAQINSDAIKSSAGALHRISVSRVSHLADAVFLLQTEGVKIVAVHEKAEIPLNNFRFDGPVCLIFGSEEKGISHRLIKMSDHSVKIPLAGEIESLNVSVAAGMAMYEVARQRDKTGNP